MEAAVALAREEYALTIWLRNLLARWTTAMPATAHRCTRLELEALEDRRVPTVTFHGGALLPHVEAQAFYLGSDWQTNAADARQARSLDSFVKDIVAGPYMDMLATAGYGVGRGSADAGKVGAVTLNKRFALTDDAIQAYLQGSIKTGLLKSPDANRLYVVFVEPDVLVRAGDGEISRTDFLGYHGAFAGRDKAGNPADVRYAVIAYPGGAIGNAAVAGVSALNDLTEVASHEIAEAVTDPDVNYSALGWYDDVLNGEAGDIVNQQFVALDGYAVQRIADLTDQAMTPAGAAPLQAASFALLTDGRLFEHTVAGWTFVEAGVAALSNQAIDNNGRAVVAVVMTNGQAFEYHDGGSWVFLDNNVQQAQAGQGVTYVLRKDGRLFEYRDATGQWSGPLAVNVASVDAGTDRLGVSMVDVVARSGQLSEYSDATGWHALCGGAKAVSAGPLGFAVVLLADGRAFTFREATGTFTYVAGNVARVAAGTDPAGSPMLDLVYKNGTAVELRGAAHWTTLGSGVSAIGKARGGLVDVLFTNGNSYEHTSAGWQPLCGTTKQVG